ncbi:MAG: C25 family cysteine peptidase, partial [Pirellulales bacterium]|nr:C25 family cysteine peptidase [Pirellulales bacterium]
EGRSYHIFDQRDVDKLASGVRSPIACLLACYTGAFDEPRDCLAEHMLRAEGGPVAVLAGSRVTMPYANSVLSLAMMEEMFRMRRATLGEVIRRAKVSLASEKNKNDIRRMLDSVASAVSPRPVDLKTERREHLHLFNLLGDPLLRLPHGRAVEVKVPETIVAGTTITIEGETPIDGRAHVELAVARDRLTFRPPVREQFEDDNAALAAYNSVYRRANEHRLAAAQVDIKKGRFQTSFVVPKSARGSCHVRVFVEGRNQHALGAADVEITRP